MRKSRTIPATFAHSAMLAKSKGCQTPFFRKMCEMRAILAALAIAAMLANSGCERKQSVRIAANGLTKIRVGYIGLTCEAPIFTAVEKGFFREEGLEPELVACQWASYK